MDRGLNGNWLLRPLLMNLLVYTFLDHFTYDEPSHSLHFAVDDVAFVFNFYTLFKKKKIGFLSFYSLCTILYCFACLFEHSYVSFYSSRSCTLSRFGLV